MLLLYASFLLFSHFSIETNPAELIIVVIFWFIKNFFNSSLFTLIFVFFTCDILLFLLLTWENSSGLLPKFFKI